MVKNLIIAIRLEYNFLDQRLQDFYRVHAKRGELFSIAAIVVIALLTVGYKALTAALENPVRSLRTE